MRCGLLGLELNATGWSFARNRVGQSSYAFLPRIIILHNLVYLFILAFMKKPTTTGTFSEEQKMTDLSAWFSPDRKEISDKSKGY